jgi:hypothetical protein
MKLDRKFEIAAQAVNSIARHDDEDEATVVAILDRVSEYVEAEKQAHIKRKSDKRGALLKTIG